MSKNILDNSAKQCYHYKVKALKQDTLCVFFGQREEPWLEAPYEKRCRCTACQAARRKWRDGGTRYNAIMS